RIIAEGTEQDSILFTRLQDDNDYFWGTIYITDYAEKSIFKNCKIEYSCGIGIYVGLIAWGAIYYMNKEIEIEECLFINNVRGAIGPNVQWYEYVSILNSTFSSDENMSVFASSLYGEHIHINSTLTGYPPALVAGNIFEEDYRILFSKCYFIYNKIINNPSNALNVGSQGKVMYLYNNEFINFDTGIFNSGNSEDSLYIKNNRFIGGDEAIDIDDAYVEISDNYFEGCDLYTGSNCYGKAYNNYTASGRIRTPGYLQVFNNISLNSNSTGLIVSSMSYFCLSNIIIDNLYAIGSSGSPTYNNCIIIFNEELTDHIINGNPIFRNCIIDFELEYPLIDGGGNIWVDSLQAQTLFEDIENGDFHLIEGSLAIDAGFDTLGYYYPFDMDYNHRVWDGDNNGTAIIDIGPYEYNSPAFGGIEGSTYNPSTGEPVDYVLLKIDNQPGEFTFSDSIGNFQYKLPAGIYDIYCERMYYDDAILYEVEVDDGQFTQI
ncbi:MAG: carboxypeptidase regulatory-like domain-containing protein, partial [Candidatus Cloacimonetes bacterium]|nr:carboxypeptidase regulatory-like domain-containing protein [Candidatus Cloacimonadota bacterium]